jgi:hypothetical protein
MPRENCDWYSLGELFDNYPDLMQAVRTAYDQHEQPGGEGIVRVPGRASGVVQRVAEQWSLQQLKRADLFPYHGWAVLFAWVKYRKDSKRANYGAPPSDATPPI